MYEKIFDQSVQSEMDDFFIENLGKYGKKERFKKGQVIRQDSFDRIYVLTEGELNQVMYSKGGDEIIFYRLMKGNVFGEMAFFDRSATFVENRAVTCGEVSIVSREIVESRIREVPEMYDYFLTSIIKKHRIVMLELTNLHFNDSNGRLADFLIRLYYTENTGQRSNISIVLTHEEIAHRVGLNRITVTNGMKLFKEKGLIDIRNRKIIIMDIEGLKELSNIPVE